MVMNDSLFQPDSVNSSGIAEVKLNVYRYAVPVLTLLCIISTAANAYILISIRWLIRSPSPTLAFTLSLCAADAWVSFVMALGFVFQSYLPYVFGVSFHKQICFGLAFEAVRMGAMITSIMHLLALAINHYIGITRPLHYSATVTPEISLILICVLWIVPSSSLLIFFSIIPNQAFLSEQCGQIQFFHGLKFRATIGAFIFIPLFLMFFVYVHIFTVIVKRKTDHAHLTCNKPVTHRINHNMKATVTTTLILGTYIMGWLPCMVQFVLICNEGCLFNTYSILSLHPLMIVIISLFNNCLIILKALMDAVIYAYRVRELRIAILNMHGKVCGCHPSYGDMDWNETIRLNNSVNTNRHTRHSTVTTKMSILQPLAARTKKPKGRLPAKVAYTSLRRLPRMLSLPADEMEKSLPAVNRRWSSRRISKPDQSSCVVSENSSRKSTGLVTRLMTRKYSTKSSTRTNSMEMIGRRNISKTRAKKLSEAGLSVPIAREDSSFKEFQTPEQTNPPQNGTVVYRARNAF